jgi:hypothetical protein
MAKLSDLIPTLAKVLPMPEQTVAIYARLLRQGRLLSTGGRGPGGAKMTPEDCARLLIAVMATDQVKDAVPAVEKFWSLPVESSDTRETVTKRDRSEWLAMPKSLGSLTEASSFGVAVAGLIAAARDGTLQSGLGQATLPFLRLELERRFNTASLSLMASADGLLPDKSVLITRFAPPKTLLQKLIEEQPFNMGGDAMVSFAVSQNTILALGELIRE